MLPALAAGAVIALAGCGSLAGTGAAGQGPSSAPAAAATSSACTTRACVAGVAGKSLVGIIANDESVVTKAACRPSSVRHNAGDTWTVTCTVTYSDGSAWRGYANLLPDQGKVTFEPQEQIR